MLTNDTDALFNRAIDDHLHAVKQLSKQQEIIKSIGKRMSDAILSGRKVLWCGNGGSAADCQHLAAEFVGRFRRERRGFASIALTTDSSVLTAIGNDYCFNDIFRRQVEALGLAGDVVVGISTSGDSENIYAALAEAKKIGAYTVCFTGIGPGRIAGIADVTLRVESNDTARIQEVHILVGHLLCDWVELAVCAISSKAAGSSK